MFFGKLVHPEVLQSEADHPMVKRIVGGELVGLFFMSDCFFGSAQRRCGACELIIGQNKAAHFAARRRSKLKWLPPCGPVARAIRLFPRERESNRLAPPKPHRDSSALARNAPNGSGSCRDNTGSKLWLALVGAVRPVRATGRIARRRQRDIQTRQASIAPRYLQTTQNSKRLENGFSLRRCSRDRSD